MNVFKKIGNVIGIILAWLLSIVLVIMLVISPLMLSALDMLSADTITEILTGSLTAQTPPADERAADYSITRLSNVSDFVEEIPDAEQIAGSVDAEAIGDVGEQMLGQLFGDQLDQQDIQTILSSDMAKDFIQFYSDGITSAISGEPGEFRFDSDTVKDFVEDNLDEIVEIAKQVAPEYADVATQEAKDMIRKLVEENADELIKLLPRPDEIVQSILQDMPELEIAFDILAQRDTIKKAVVGVIAVLCVLIFLLRIPGMRGFRWLATDLFIGSGFGIVWCAVASMGTTLLEGFISFNATLAGIINPILAIFTKGLIIRTAVMLVSAIVLLVVYIVIKKALAKKACCVSEEDTACQQPAAQELPAEPAAEEKQLLQKSPSHSRQRPKESIILEKYDIIILAGQSNAEGQGHGPVTREFVPDERIHFMTDDANPKFVNEDGVIRLTMKWPAVNSVSIADERILREKKVGCFALQFAELYANTYLQPGRKVLIVNANFGGTGFARPEWGIGNCMHERMIAMTREALSYNPENRVVAVLWSQGEHDAFENADWDPDRRYRTHKTNLTATFADFYARIGCKDVPVLACGFTDSYYESNPTACDAVLAAIREVIADIGGGFVDSSGLPANSAEDFYHFNRESLHILGERFFQEYTQLRK